jgi:RNA polymerase sigma-B factor
MTATSIGHTTADQHNGSPDTAEARAVALLDALAGLSTGDPTRRAARTAAIEAWQPLAGRLAQRYARRGEPLDDLAQVAALGLIKAVDRFDPGRGAPFPAFAIPTITGEIKRHFRDRTWAVRIPRRLQDLRLAINAANNTLTHSLGHAPTVADVAAHLGVTEDDVVEGLEGARAYQSTSLSAPVCGDDSVDLGDTIGVTEHGYEATELHLALQPALAALDGRDQRIIALRFYGNRTQTQIADELGISQMHVSRLLARAIGRLRTRMSLDG